MPEPIQANELLIRMSCFLGILAVMAAWEMVAPMRDRHIPRRLRWTSNLGIVVIDIVVVRLVFPIGAVGLAVLAQERGWGLFNVFEITAPLAFALSVLALDLTIYLQHVMFHAVPTLWRLHRMHHTDLDYDLTTGNRFHPLSIIISAVIKMFVVLVMGPALVAVLISEVLLNLTSVFNHSNIKLPQRLDRLLRLVLVTPDMHNIHHSQDEIEHNCNFGFCFPWWDRMFDTYLDEAALSHQSLKIGIKGFDKNSSIWIYRARSGSNG